MNGRLHDNTSYRDEDFNNFYPEVQAVRQQIAIDGEFVKESTILYELRASEIEHLRHYGYYEDIRGTENDIKPSFEMNRIMDKKNSINKIQDSNNDHNNSLDIRMKNAYEDINIIRKKRARDRAFLIKKRFPEDDYSDSFESGQMNVWRIIELNVPEINIFIDKELEMIMKNELLHDHNDDHQKENKDEMSAASDNNSKQSKYSLSLFSHNHKQLKNDLQYAILTKDNIRDVGQTAALIPDDHPIRDDLLDWDIIRTKKSVINMSKFTKIHNAKQVSKHVKKNFHQYQKSLSNNKMMTNDNDSLSLLTALGNDIDGVYGIEAEQQVRFQLCRFAEILLSVEVSRNCTNIRY
jgi:hypothetical protein